MNIYLIGTSHRYSSVEIRERIAFADHELEAALHDLRAGLASEAVIVSTCNRTEIYIVPRDDRFDPRAVRQWLSEWKGIEIGRDHLFTLEAHAAARHLFEVSSGVDSQIIGDIQIIGQVKQAYQIARDAGALGKLLSRLFSSALRTGKRVKTETDLFTGAASISYAAVELARKIFHPFGDKRTLVVGAGDTGNLTTRSLYGQGVRDITITNRTEARARDLIRSLGVGAWMPLDMLDARLHEFDIVIVSTRATEYLITYDMARRSIARRSGDMQLIVDISMPRNVDPRVSTLPDLFCKDLNDLNSVIDSNLERRRGELPRVHAIIDEELAAFASWCNLLPVTPVIAKLQRQTEEIIRAELEKNRHRFSNGDFTNVEKLVASIVKKIIGMPMSHLLNSEADIADTLQKAELVSLLFNLGDDGVSSGELADLHLNGEERDEDAMAIEERIVKDA